MNQVILVTGASSGFGRLMANALAMSYAVIDRVRAEFLHRIGFAHLMKPRDHQAA